MTRLSRFSAALLAAGLVVGLATAKPGVTGTAAQQSPVDIRSGEYHKTHLAPLQFSYSRSTPLTVVNTGSPDEFATVRANVPDGAGTLTLDGVPYKLLQFHWHTPGEHEFNGERYPLEMHLVHQAQDGTLLVVGVTIKEGKVNKELAKIFSDLPTSPANNRTVESFNLRKLLPSSHKSFRYQGSLTTPPYTEGVKWNVLATPIELSSTQVGAFMALFPTGNSREVQPLNGREIESDAKKVKAVP